MENRTNEERLVVDKGERDRLKRKNIEIETYIKKQRKRNVLKRKNI